MRSGKLPSPRLEHINNMSQGSEWPAFTQQVDACSQLGRVMVDSVRVLTESRRCDKLAGC